MFDRFTAVPVFLTAAAAMMGLGWWLSHLLKRRAAEGI